MKFQHVKRSLSRIQSHPECGFDGYLRYASWQLRRRQGKFPFTVPLTSRSKLEVRQPSDLNGCISLVWTQRLYDYNNMNFFRDFCEASENCVVWDIGANIGTYSLLISEVEKVSIHAFEPHPETLKSFENNVIINERKNIELHGVALSNENGMVHFTDDAGSAVNQVMEQGGGIEVRATRGEDFAKEIQSQPNVLKIDVEGHELEVLLGLGEVLKGVDLLAIEENIDLKECSHLLGHLEGPFFIDYQNRNLKKERGDSKEDPVYLSLESLQRIEKVWEQR